MKRYERTQILIEGDSSLAQEIASEIEVSYPIEIIEVPHDELVMVKVRESARNSLFYLGESLMCSCQVRIAASVGFGMVFGRDHSLAYNLAVIDAAFFLADEPAAKQSWTEKIKTAGKALQAQRAKEIACIGKTRVDFSTMEVEA